MKFHIKGQQNYQKSNFQKKTYFMELIWIAKNLTLMELLSLTFGISHAPQGKT